MDTVIQKLFRINLNRTATPAEIATYDLIIATQGLSNAMLQFFRSIEYRTYVVKQYYNIALYRLATDTEAAQWATSNYTLEQIYANICSSAEFQSK